jgi:hypothetical protein
MAIIGHTYTALILLYYILMHISYMHVHFASLYRILLHVTLLILVFICYIYKIVIGMEGILYSSYTVKRCPCNYTRAAGIMYTLTCIMQTGRPRCKIISQV